MSHPTECRQCTRCGYTWNAERWTKPARPQILLTFQDPRKARRDYGFVLWSRCGQCQATGRAIKTIKNAYALNGRLVTTTLLVQPRPVSWAPPAPENKRG